MSPLVGAALLLGLIGLPAWLLVTGRKLRYRSRRARGAFWGGVAGYLIADVLFLLVVLRPPMRWPPEWGAWTLPAALLVPPLIGLAVGAAVGRAAPARRR